MGGWIDDWMNGWMDGWMDSLKTTKGNQGHPLPLICLNYCTTNVKQYITSI